MRRRDFISLLAARRQRGRLRRVRSLSFAAEAIGPMYGVSS